MRPALLCTLLLGSALLSGPARAATADTSGPMTVQSQGSFFIGGTARHAEGLSGGTTGPEVARMGAITTGQMYVQYQIPVAPRHLPVVLVHGGGLRHQFQHRLVVNGIYFGKSPIGAEHSSEQYSWYEITNEQEPNKQASL